MKNRRFWCRAVLTVATVQFVWICIRQEPAAPSAHFPTARSVNGGCDLRDDSAPPSELASAIERINSQPTLLQQSFQRDFVDIDGAAALDIVKIVYRLAADFPVCLAGKVRSLFTVSRSPECGYSGFHSFQCCCVFYCVVMVVAVSLAPTAVDL